MTSISCTMPSIHTPIWLPVILFITPVRSECTTDPRKRNAQFETCPEDFVNSYGLIGDSVGVPSPMFCAMNCMANAECASYNVKKAAGTFYECQLSFETPNCLELESEAGSRTYTKQPDPDPPPCTNPWRVALKTAAGTTLQGSLESLREAALSGARMHVVLEPHPLSIEDQNYGGSLIVFDTVEIRNGVVIGYSYAFFMSMGSPPSFAMFKIASSGEGEFFSDGTVSSAPEMTITWVVQDVFSKCYQQNELNQKGPVKIPALTVTRSELGGDWEELDTNVLSDFLNILMNFATIRIARTMDGQIIQTSDFYGVSLDIISNTVKAMATWIADSGYLSVNMVDWDLLRSDMVLTGQLNMTSSTLYDTFIPDPRLLKTDYFFDPCWHLTLAVSGTDIVVGTVENFIAKIQSGASVGFLFANDTQLIYAVAEVVEMDTVLGLVQATGKMGVSLDQGITWLEVVATSSATFSINGLFSSGMYTMYFYVDRRVRSYRYTIRSGNEVEGSFSGVKTRLSLGLIPRVMFEISDEAGSSWEQIYLEIEYVTLASQRDDVILASHRAPRDLGFMIYYIELSGSIRATVSWYTSYGSDKFSPHTNVKTITLFFEESGSVDLSNELPEAGETDIWDDEEEDVLVDEGSGGEEMS